MFRGQGCDQRSQGFTAQLMEASRFQGGKSGWLTRASAYAQSLPAFITHNPARGMALGALLVVQVELECQGGCVYVHMCVYLCDCVSVCWCDFMALCDSVVPFVFLRTHHFSGQEF